MSARSLESNRERLLIEPLTQPGRILRPLAKPFNCMPAVMAKPSTTSTTRWWGDLEDGVNRSTLISWGRGKKVPRAAISLEILGRIERHRLPHGLLSEPVRPARPSTVIS